MTNSENEIAASEVTAVDKNALIVEKVSRPTEDYSEEPPKKVTRRGERDERDERRMEINRLRAKQIRKRKKEMEEDMQKQIIQLTLENNKLRTQLKVQETEIALLRGQQMNRPVFQQQPQSYHPHLFSHQHMMAGNPLDMLSSSFNNQGMFQNNPALTQIALGAVPNTQPTNQALLPNIAASSLAAQAGIASTENKHDLNFLGTATGSASGAQDNHHHATMSNNTFDMQDDADQQSLAKLLTGSSSHVKQSLLEKLQSEGNIGREQMQ